MENHSGILRPRVQRFPSLQQETALATRDSLLIEQSALLQQAVQACFVVELVHRDSTTGIQRQRFNDGNQKPTTGANGVG